MIQVERVSKKYALSKKQQKELLTTEKEFFASKDISFTCRPGRVYSLLGPNGAGKTTMLRMISTILKPTSGEITVNGFSATTQPVDVRRSIGFLTGSTNLYDRLTPSEVVKYFADLHGIKKEEFQSRRKTLFDKLGINDFEKKRIGQLSTGMKQKVSIARTMIHDPSVVIFDEPTSGLDVITAENIIDLIRSCKAEGKTVIFSSHIMSEVDLLCDDLGIINKGALIYESTMDEFRKHHHDKSLTEAFIEIVNKNNKA